MHVCANVCMNSQPNTVMCDVCDESSFKVFQAPAQGGKCSTNVL